MAILLPAWLQPYVLMVPFQLAAMMGGELQQLRDARTYIYNTGLAMVNRARKQ